MERCEELWEKWREMKRDGERLGYVKRLGEKERDGDKEKEGIMERWGGWRERDSVVSI